MFCYSYVKTVNIEKLDKELKASHLPYSYLETVDNKLNLWMEVDLTAEQHVSLDSIIETHVITVTVNVEDMVRDRIIKAMDFGRNFIVSYATDNIMAGYTITDIQYILEKTSAVTNALSTGSLYVALDELNKLQPDHLITQPILDKYRHKLQDYLGLPRT